MALHSYEAEGQPANAERFTRIACDPGRSVVVEACAGSGKTWLLVARALRLLLEGAEPPELLAITFTRKAAQEMHARLMSLLKELALAPKGKVEELLLERGVPPLELGKAVPAARQLYERVLASAQPVAFDTFHGWFSRLLRHAPLGSGVPHGYALAETTGDLRAECFRRFVQELADKGNGEANDETRKSLERLYELLGDHKTHGLIDAFVDQRAEWWAAGLEGSPIEWLETLCGEDGRRDARLTLWEDMALHLRVINIARVLGKGAKPNQGRAVKIESAISAGCSIEAFASLLKEFCDDKGNCRSNNYKTKALVDAAAAAFGTVEAFQAEFEEVAAELHDLECRGNETKVLEINRHLFTVGRPYLDTYQSLKAERRVLDFTDLEWHAYRLMNDPEQAAYLMARLDSRYRHILLDEFQDT
ncbi:MAG: ATP-dependent exonuclease, partial [Paucimonas sp.]|nr:ATP-dependent exonuclease [Paucimonas sp.]